MLIYALSVSDSELILPLQGDTYLYNEDAWITSSASFNPYQCEFVKLEVLYLVTVVTLSYIMFQYPSHSVCIQTYSSLVETPHEALLDKLQKMEACKQNLYFCP